MTLWLLGLAGVLWCVLTYVIVRFLARTRLARASKVVVPVVAGLCLYPLVQEYWTYAKFQTWCSVNAGWSRLEPVKADTILLEARGTDIKNALSAATVKNILFREVPVPKHKLRFIDGGPRPEDQLPDKGEVCLPKVLATEGEGPDAYGWPGLSAYGLAHQLHATHICVSFDAALSMPRYRVRLWQAPEPWYKKVDQPPSVDRVFQLFDEQSGALLSEYKFATGPHGWLTKLVWPNSWARYNCGAQAFHTGPFEGRWNGSVTWFLEQVLLPVQN